MSNSRNPQSIVVSKMTSGWAEPLSHLIADVISELPAYGDEAKIKEIAKFTPDALKALALREPNAVWVASANSTLVAFAVCQPDDDLLWLRWIGVTPDYRQQGVAQVLIRAIEEEAREKHVRKIWCATRTTNTESRHFFNSQEFLPLCTAFNHWHGHDYILWEKPI